MSRWPWVGKPRPGWTRSSLITRRAWKPMCVGGIEVVAERERMPCVQPAEIEAAALARRPHRDHARLLVTKALDRVQLRGLPRRVEAEEDPDGARERERDQDRRRRDERRPAQAARQQPRDGEP